MSIMLFKQTDFGENTQVVINWCYSLNHAKQCNQCKHIPG